MEQNQMNYEMDQETKNYPEVVTNSGATDSKLPLINTIFSGLTLVIAIAILIITMMNTMARPMGINRIGGGRPNFEINGGEVLPES